MKKVLFISDFSTHYPNSIVDALKYHGCEVYVPQYEKFKETNRLIKFFYKSQHKKKYVEKFNKFNVDALNKVNPDFIFVVNDYFMAPSFFELCIKRGIPVYGYCQDALSYCNKAMEGNDVFGHLKYYTAYYSYEPTDVKFCVKKNEHVKYMPLGFDERFFVKKETPSCYEYDVFFAGSLDKERKKVLNAVAEYCNKHNLKMCVKTGIQLHHCESIMLLPKLFMRRLRFKIFYPYLYRCLDNNTLPIKETAKIYSKSRFCINMHNSDNPEEHTGPNPRTFETMAAGTCLLTDKDHLFGTGFEDGRHIVTFGNINELIDKFEHYLKNEGERKRIAMEGKEVVWKSFSERSLILQLLKNEKLL